MVGEFVRNRRKALGLSQRQLAADAGIWQAKVSQIEGGTALPSLVEVGQLSEALNVDPCAFLQAFSLIEAPVDFTRLGETLVRALRELDDRGLEVLAYTARGLLPLQSEEPGPPPPESPSLEAE